MNKLSDKIINKRHFSQNTKKAIDYLNQHDIVLSLNTGSFQYRNELEKYITYLHDNHINVTNKDPYTGYTVVQTMGDQMKDNDQYLKNWYHVVSNIIMWIMVVVFAAMFLATRESYHLNIGELSIVNLCAGITVGLVSSHVTKTILDYRARIMNPRVYKTFQKMLNVTTNATQYAVEKEINQTKLNKFHSSHKT